MKVCTCFLLFRILVNTDSIAEDRLPEDEGVNFELYFKNGDNSGDENTSGNEKYLTTRDIDKKNNSRPVLRAPKVVTFTGFIQEAINILNTYEDTSYEVFFNILHDEIRKYHYRGCKFYELTENYETRKELAAKLDLIKGKPVSVMKANINALADIIRDEKCNKKVKEFLGYINSLYRQDAEQKFHKVLKDLKCYGKSKSKRSQNKIVKVIRNGLRSIVFNHYTNLNSNARRELKEKIVTLYAPLKEIPSSSTKTNFIPYTPAGNQSITNIVTIFENITAKVEEYKNDTFKEKESIIQGVTRKSIGDKRFHDEETSLEASEKRKSYSDEISREISIGNSIEFSQERHRDFNTQRYVTLFTEEISLKPPRTTKETKDIHKSVNRVTVSTRSTTTHKQRHSSKYESSNEGSVWSKLESQQETKHESRYNKKFESQHITQHKPKNSRRALSKHRTTHEPKYGQKIEWNRGPKHGKKSESEHETNDKTVKSKRKPKHGKKIEEHDTDEDTTQEKHKTKSKHAKPIIGRKGEEHFSNNDLNGVPFTVMEKNEYRKSLSARKDMRYDFTFALVAKSTVPTKPVLLRHVKIPRLLQLHAEVREKKPSEQTSQTPIVLRFSKPYLLPDGKQYDDCKGSVPPATTSSEKVTTPKIKKGKTQNPKRKSNSNENLGHTEFNFVKRISALERELNELKKASKNKIIVNNLTTVAMAKDLGKDTERDTNVKLMEEFEESKEDDGHVFELKNKETIKATKKSITTSSKLFSPVNVTSTKPTKVENKELNTTIEGNKKVMMSSKDYLRNNVATRASPRTRRVLLFSSPPLYGPHNPAKVW